MDRWTDAKQNTTKVEEIRGAHRHLYIYKRKCVRTIVRTDSCKHESTYAHTDGPGGRAGVEMSLQTDGLRRAYAHMHSHPRANQVRSKVRKTRNSRLFV